MMSTDSPEQMSKQAGMACHYMHATRVHTVRTNAPPPSGEVRVPLYGRHRLFSELARDTHTHTLTSHAHSPIHVHARAPAHAQGYLVWDILRLDSTEYCDA
jgi:hypothetical protein